MSTAAAAIACAGRLLAMFYDSGKPVAMRDPCQVASQNVNSERRRHAKRPYPETPVPMHTLPVRTGARFAAFTTISLMIVPVSCHLFSISAEYSPRRAVWLQRAR